jgi:hypothetical protein
MKNTKSNKNNKSKTGAPRFDDAISYKGQQRFSIKLAAAPILLTSTVTTGVLQGNMSIDAALVQGFATRFGSTFDEYRIKSAKVMIRPVSASSGVTVFWFDEKSSATPTANEAQERMGLRICNSNANSKSVRVMSWKAHDFLDLNYTAIGTTTVAPVYFKAYSDATTWGNPIVATSLFVLEPEIVFEFKGIKST